MASLADFGRLEFASKIHGKGAGGSGSRSVVLYGAAVLTLAGSRLGRKVVRMPIAGRKEQSW
jgi:hypothetical protein